MMKNKENVKTLKLVMPAAGCKMEGDLNVYVFWPSSLLLASRWTLLVIFRNRVL